MTTKTYHLRGHLGVIHIDVSKVTTVGEHYDHTYIKADYMTFYIIEPYTRVMRDVFEARMLEDTDV